MDAQTSALIERARRGENAAFEALMRGYQDKIHRLARRACAAAPDEDDNATRRKELSDAVAAALAGLPLEQRLVLTLHDVEGLSAEETSKILEFSVPAVTARLHRARRLLRDRFQASRRKIA